MRILLFPCTYTCLNMGDVAMLQVAVERLGALWPDARIDVPTKDPEALARYVPSARPVPHGAWFSDHELLGSLHKRVPAWLSRRLIDAKWAVRRSRPDLEEAALRRKLKLRRSDASEFEAAAEAARAADLVLVSGAADFTDTFPTFSVTVLATLARAIQRGKPTALFSHGVGPLRSPRLFRRTASVLRSVDLIALREGRSGRPLLDALGVPADRIAVTGDDAIEPAYRARSHRRGDAVGVNVRVGSSVHVGPDLPGRLRPIVQEFARQVRAPLSAVPIARQQSIDADAIEEVFEGFAAASDGGRDLDTPERVMERVGRCRIVVTGAYHAAVFALSQGIPVVGLSNCDYSTDKFLGLADQFGGGCETVLLDAPDWPVTLKDAMRRAWASADAVREPLRRAAVAQIEACRSAYRMVGEIAGRRSDLPRAAALPDFADTQWETSLLPRQGGIA